MTKTRREVIKDMAASWALSVVGAAFSGCRSEPEPGVEAALFEEPGVTWGNAPCRFCGVGCGVMVGVRDEKVVAVAGDRQNPVNLGLPLREGLPFAHHPLRQRPPDETFRPAQWPVRGNLHGGGSRPCGGTVQAAY